MRQELQADKITKVRSHELLRQSSPQEKKFLRIGYFKN
jgi:hypothetical protein